MTGENINVDQVYLFLVFSVFILLTEISFEREHFLLGVNHLQRLQAVSGFHRELAELHLSHGVISLQ